VLDRSGHRLDTWRQAALRPVRACRSGGNCKVIQLHLHQDIRRALHPSSRPVRAVSVFPRCFARRRTKGKRHWEAGSRGAQWTAAPVARTRD
jgi:hypothetical protein